MLNEYWISPEGEIIPIEDHPIRTILAEPLKFGYTIEMMQVIYAKYNDDNQAEGEATKTIIKDLLSKGWSYCSRKKEDKDWRLELHKLDKKTRFNLRLWAEYMLDRGLLDMEDSLRFYRYAKNSRIIKSVALLLNDDLF